MKGNRRVFRWTVQDALDLQKLAIKYRWSYLPDRRPLVSMQELRELAKKKKITADTAKTRLIRLARNLAYEINQQV